MNLFYYESKFNIKKNGGGGLGRGGTAWEGLE